MKSIKKFFAALLAVVMVFALVAFSACTDPEGGGGNNNKEEENNNNNNNNNNNGNNTPVENEALFNALKNQSLDYLSISVNSNEKSYDGGQILSTKKFEINGKINLADGDADLLVRQETSESGSPKASGYYGYAFFRDWNAFASDELEKQATDISEIPLIYGGNGLDVMITALSDYGIGDMLTSSLISTICNYAVSYGTYVLALYADLTDSLTVESGKATIDLNKMIYTIVSDVKTVVDELTLNTTVSDLLANETVKKYVSVITELIPSTIVETIPSLLASAGTMIPEEYAELFVDVPFSVLESFTSDATTNYDYLVDFITSEEFNEVFRAALPVVIEIVSSIGGGGSLPDDGDIAVNPGEEYVPDEGVNGTETYATEAEGGEETEISIPNIGEITVDYLISAFGDAESEPQDVLDAFIDSFDEGISAITATELKYYSSETNSEYDEETGNYVKVMTAVEKVVKGLKVEFALDGNSVTGINFAMNMTTARNDSVDWALEISAVITYSDTAFTLEDINGNTVNYSFDYSNDGTSYVCDVELAEAEVTVKVELTKTDGTVYVSKVSDADGNELTYDTERESYTLTVGEETVYLDVSYDGWGYVYVNYEYGGYYKCAEFYVEYPFSSTVGALLENLSGGNSDIV